MRCYYHPDREATGQCANEQCKVYLCAECVMESRKNATNMTLCRVCLLNEIRQKRKTAKGDMRFFKIFAVLGLVLGILSAILLSILVMFGGIGFLGGTPFLIAAIIFTPLAPYICGAEFLGLKKTVGWCWRSTIKIIPLTILAVIVFLVALVFILLVGMIVGIFATPFWLRDARRTLRETAYIETLPESAFVYPMPPITPTYQTPPTTNTKANFCKNCGTPVKPNATFCTACGKQV